VENLIHCLRDTPQVVATAPVRHGMAPRQARARGIFAQVQVRTPWGDRLGVEGLGSVTIAGRWAVWFCRGGSRR
jgi:hypothetical protein